MTSRSPNGKRLLQEKKVESVPCVPIFDTGERHAKDLFQKGMISRKDVLGALKLASLKTRINNRTVDVSGQSAPKNLDTWVFGLYNRGGVVGITNDTKRRPWLSRLVTAMIRAERPGFEFSAFSINQNLEIGMHRDTANLKGSMNAVIGLNKFSGGQLWVEDPKGSVEKAIPVDKLTKDGPTKVLGRLIATSEKAVTFDGRKWRCAEPTRDERLTSLLHSLRYQTDEEGNQADLEEIRIRSSSARQHPAGFDPRDSDSSGYALC